MSGEDHVGPELRDPSADIGVAIVAPAGPAGRRAQRRPVIHPARIRYTSMSLPYHIGNGWFGGFLPTIAFAMVAATGDIYYGLWYPIGIALMTAVLGILFMPETKDREIHHDA